MSNPFDKYLGPEDLLQKAVMDYLKLQYSKAIFFHPINEGKRTKFEQYKAKILGISSGVPDVMIFNNGGLAIELKVGKNRPTQNQIKWMADLESVGWICHVCYGFDSAKVLIDKFLKR